MPNIYWIDLFCGAGGTSTGIHLVGDNVKVLACVNHDKNAIQSHKANHPEAYHFNEDIRGLAVIEKVRLLVEKIRKQDPTVVINLWASLECTNHSKAKGGKPKNADSRSLADYMNLYIEAIQPDYFEVENVREFMAWGPLDENGKPISRNNGQDFLRWVNEICSLGYHYDYRILNAADYGAYQNRERLFIQFAKHGLSIAWPEPTHQKNPKPNGMFTLKKHKAVKDILDLEDEGVSIFQRKKDLSDNTLKRIYAGLVKFVANGEDTFTKRYNGGKVHPEQKVNSLNKPIGTILSNCTHAIVKTVYIKKYYSGRPEGKVISVNGPSGTVTTIDGQAIVSVQHLNTYYGNGGIHSIQEPSPTITTKDRVAKVAVNFIDNQYGTGTPTSVNQPIGSLTTVPKSNIVKVDGYIFNPGWGGHTMTIENPCCTVVARQDKAPLQLLVTECGQMMIPIYESDSPTMVLIKRFMIEYGISDIKLRMLKISELKRIQGFPADYTLIGTQTEQKKYIGNAVQVDMAAALIRANTDIIHHTIKTLQYA